MVLPVTTTVRDVPVSDQRVEAGPSAGKLADAREALAAGSPLGQDQGAPQTQGEQALEDAAARLTRGQGTDDEAARAEAQLRGQPQDGQHGQPAQQAQALQLPPELQGMSTEDLVRHALAYQAILDTPQLNQRLREGLLEMPGGTAPANGKAGGNGTAPDGRAGNGQAAPAASDQVVAQLQQRIARMELKAEVDSFRASHPDAVGMESEIVDAVKRYRVPLEAAYRIVLGERVRTGNQGQARGAAPAVERQGAGGPTGGTDVMQGLEALVGDRKLRTEQVVERVFNELLRRG